MFGGRDRPCERLGWRLPFDAGSLLRCDLQSRPRDGLVKIEAPTIGIYPGKSLDLELSVTIPWDWGISESADLVTKAMLDRARDEQATVRERGTAAMGLWQRAFQNDRSTDPSIRRTLSELVESFKTDTSDVSDGLRWVATTLQHAIDENVAMCVTLPRSEEPWYQAVESVRSRLVGAVSS